MEETKELQKLYSFMQAAVYFFVILDVVLYINFPFTSNLKFVVNLFARIILFNNVIYTHLFIFVILVLTSIGTRAKKEINIKPIKIILPISLGLVLFFGGLGLIFYRETNVYSDPLNIAYIVSIFLGTLFLHVGLDNISKIVKSNFGQDPFNKENESFDQNRKLVKTEYSVNIPMEFYYKKRTHKGWINIVNPFRGSMVIGTPGSGKTFSVINEYIRQLSAKGFSLFVYDFKYPDLAKIAYYHFILNKRKGILPKNTKFHVINFDDVEKSRRINPLAPRYIKKLADAMDAADSLVESLMKGGSKMGSEKFFTQSAVNFLGGCMYFFAKYKNGKYSTLPHILEFLNYEYDDIFNVLLTEPELHSIISPFRNAYENNANEQLEGQIGTLKVFVSRLNTKESAWIFSGDDFDLKISDKKNPSYVVLANNINTQNINSALGSVVLSRLVKTINTKGNRPTAVVVDELDSMYFHKVNNLMATARSNKVAVLLGLQELPQLTASYGKHDSEVITAVCGNILSGSARHKPTLDWLQQVFGKVKQKSEGVSVQRNRTTINLNEKMDYLIPASKIAGLRSGELVGQVALDFGQEKLLKNTMYNCKTKLDLKKIEKEKKNYLPLPRFYDFKDNKDVILNRNFIRIKNEVEKIVFSCGHENN